MSARPVLSPRSARRIARQVGDRERQSQARPIAPRPARAPGVAYPFIAQTGSGGIGSGAGSPASASVTVYRFGAGGTLVAAESITVWNVADGPVAANARIICDWCQGEDGIYPVVIWEQC